MTGVLLAAALVFAPLSFGAAEPWAGSVLALLGLLALGTAVAQSAVMGGIRDLAAPTLLPVAGALGLLGLQYARWPAPVLSLVSPRTVSAYTSAAAAAGKPPPGRVAPSLFRQGTRRALVRLTAYASLFTATWLWARSRRRLAVLAGVIVVCGLVCALLGVIQKLSGTGRIYWWRQADHGAFFGPFAGRNQFASYAALCSLVGVGLGLGWVARTDGRVSWRTALADHGPTALLLSFAVAFTAAAVVWSLSRGGTVALGAGFTGTFLLAGLRRRRGHGRLTVLVALLAVVGLITYLGWEPVFTRMGSIGEVLRSPGTTWRWRMAGDALRMGAAFPVLGTGAGTFMSAYPAWRTVPTDALLEAAHNDYAQIFAETGMAGSLLFLAFAVLITGAVGRGLTKGNDGFTSGLLAGGGGALLSIGVHAMVDYPLRSPAVAGTLAVFVAMLCRASQGLPAQGESGLGGRDGAGGSTPPAGFAGRPWGDLTSPSDHRPSPILSHCKARTVAATGALLVLWIFACGWVLVPLHRQLDQRAVDRAFAREPGGAVVLGLVAEHTPRTSDDARLASRLGGLCLDAIGSTEDPVHRLQFGERALALHQDAAVREPMNAAHPFAAAVTCLAWGRPDLAVPAAERAIDLLPGSRLIRLRMADAFLDGGAPAVAGHYLADAERLPGTATSQRLLSKLRRRLEAMGAAGETLPKGGITTR